MHEPRVTSHELRRWMAHGAEHVTAFWLVYGTLGPMRPVWGFPGHSGQIRAALLVAVLLLAARWRRTWTIVQRVPLMWGLPLFALAVGLSDPKVMASLRAGIPLWTACALGAYLATRYTARQQVQLLVSAATLAAGVTVYYCLNGVGLDRYQRWTGAFRHKNSLGLACGLALCGALLLLVTQKRGRWAYAGVSVLFMTLLQLAESRTPAVAALLAALALAAWVLLRGVSVRVRVWAGVAALLTLMLGIQRFSFEVLALLGRSQTLSGRTMVWEKVLAQMPAKPWLGHGIGTFQADAGKRMFGSVIAGWVPGAAHNSFLEVLFATGALGLVLFLVGTAAVGWRAMRATSSEKDEVARYWPLAIFVFFLGNAMAESAVLHSHPILFAALVAAALAREDGGLKPVPVWP